MPTWQFDSEDVIRISLATILEHRIQCDTNLDSRMWNSFICAKTIFKKRFYQFKFWLVIWSFDRTCRIFSAALWLHPLAWRDLLPSFLHQNQHLWGCPFWHQLGFGHRLFYSGEKMMAEGFELASWEEQEEEGLGSSRDSCSLSSCASTWSSSVPSISPSRTSPQSSSYQLLILPKHPFFCPKILKLDSFWSLFNHSLGCLFFKPGFSFPNLGVTFPTVEKIG